MQRKSIFVMDVPWDRRALLRGNAKILGRRAYYSMVRTAEHTYRYTICYCGQRAEHSVICAGAAAERIFFALLKGRVTPCSAVYIIKELAE